MLKTILFILWFFLPAALANLAAFFSSKIPFVRNFTYPIDCYRTFRNKRIFDDHKTIRGFISGIVISIITVFLQIYAFNHIQYIKIFSSINYNSINPWILGILAGIGPLTGDAIKSFFKRQLGIPPGKSWFPFDQSDYILGGMLFTSFYVRLNVQQYILLFALWFLMHPVFNLLGYFLRLKKEKL